jgi:V/A-type H+-transporting ATPase subunit I
VQDVPPPSGYGGSLVEALPTMRERAAAIPSELEACRAQRTGLLARHAPQLRRAAAVVRDQLAQLDALSYTAVTSNLFVLDGWLPSGTEGRLSRALSGNCGDDVVLETLDRAGWEGEDVPVVLRNPRLFRPFELLTGLLPLPRYGTIDPTPYVAVTFPMFFGLMLGDAGYGAVLALLDLILHRRSRPDTPLRAVAEVTGPCALFAVIFCVLFGEYFGDLGRRWLGLQPLWLDRGEAIVPFLLLTLSIGLVHVVLGLTLGVLASARAHPRQALGRGISAVMILLIVLALLAAVEVLPHAVLTPAVVALLVAFPLLIVLEGVVAAVELLSAIGHILSYARIMALGTASVMLAIVANQLGGAMGSPAVPPGQLRARTLQPGHPRAPAPLCGVLRDVLQPWRHPVPAAGPLLAHVGPHRLAKEHRCQSSGSRSAPRSPSASRLSPPPGPSHASGPLRLRVSRRSRN